MKIIITAATAMEWTGIFEKLEIDNPFSNLDISFHKSGVGLLASTFSLSKMMLEDEPKLVIQVGIAGSFDKNLLPGKVVMVEHEIPGDTGVEEDGIFKDIFEMHLADADEFPYFNKKLSNPWLKQYNLTGLEKVIAISINEITTMPRRIEQLKSKYQPSIESMEGAALHYCGLQLNIPFVQIRAISNEVGERDKAKWEMDKALSNLTKSTLDYLAALNDTI